LVKDFAAGGDFVGQGRGDFVRSGCGKGQAKCGRVS